ncbi:hypothetical protein EDD21DRAFT_195158 [Dissophora ornata]|nr:hypothetical protein EDD21DRAFT_195158 [Dissophora ornata]
MPTSTKSGEKKMYTNITSCVSPSFIAFFSLFSPTPAAQKCFFFFFLFRSFFSLFLRFALASTPNLYDVFTCCWLSTLAADSSSMHNSINLAKRSNIALYGQLLHAYYSCHRTMSGIRSSQALLKSNISAGSTPSMASKRSRTSGSGWNGYRPASVRNVRTRFMIVAVVRCL